MGTAEFPGELTTQPSPREGGKSVDVEGQKKLAFAGLQEWRAAAERVNNGRQVLANLGEVFTEMETIEKVYAASLARLANRIYCPQVEGSTVREAMGALRNDLLRRSHHSHEFATALRADVLDQTLLATIENHRNVFQQIKTDALTQLKYLAEASSEHNLALRLSVEKTKIALKDVHDAQACLVNLPQQRARLHLSALKSTVEARKAEASYRLRVERLNLLRKGHANQLVEVLRSLEDMDRKRIFCLRDSLTKSYVYRVSQNRNVEYDTNTCVEAIKAIDGDLDLKEFVQSQNSVCDAAEAGELDEVPMLSLEEREKQLEVSGGGVAEEGWAATSMRATTQHSAANSVRSFFRDLASSRSIRDSARSTGSDKTERMVSAPYRELVEDAVNLYKEGDAALAGSEENEVKGYRELLDCLWRADFGAVKKLCPDGKLEIYCEEFNNAFNRQAFCSALQNMLEEQKFRLPNMYALVALVTICTRLLHWIDAHNDVWSGRELMLCSTQITVVGSMDDDPQKRSLGSFEFPDEAEQEKFCAVAEDAYDNDLPEGTVARHRETTPERVIWRLSRALYEHNFWNKVQFWEDAFLLSVSEDQQREFLMSIWREETTKEEIDALELHFRKSNRSWSSLCLFGYYMLSFGILAPQVTEMVRSLCQRYNLGAEYANRLTESVQPLC